MSSSSPINPGWAPAPGEVLTVSDLTARVREMTETIFHDLWVEGEISNLRIPASGHGYFTKLELPHRMRL